MPAVKIAIQLASLRVGLRKALPLAARLGATAVEIDARGEIKPQDLTQTGLREFRRMFEEFSLGVSAVSFHTRRGYDVPDEIERRVIATKAAMKFAADLHAPVVINQIGRATADKDSAARGLLIQTLTDLAAYGQHVGAVLAAQTGSESGPELAALLDVLPPQGIGVDLDPGKLIINGYSPLEAVQALASNIRHVHARDGVRDLARGRGLEVPLGRGSADFASLLGALEERQYRGYFTVAREEADDPVFEIGEAIKYLRSL